MITEAHGIPLAVSLTGGQRNDVTQLMPLIEAIPPVRGRRGRPRQRPVRVYADRGYDHDKYRRQVRDNGITPVIARRSTEHGSGLGVLPLGGRAVHRAAALVPAAADPLGDPRRHPRGLPQPRLRHHLLAPPAEPLTLLGPLRRPVRLLECPDRASGIRQSRGPAEPSKASVVNCGCVLAANIAVDLSAWRRLLGCTTATAATSRTPGRTRCATGCRACPLGSRATPAPACCRSGGPGPGGTPS